MNFASALLPARVVDALGWTLFHSLWQGALAALAFALVLYLTRQYSARVRYVLGLMALLLVLAASIMTFFTYYGDQGHGASAAVVAPAAAAGEAAPVAMPRTAVPGERSTAARIAAFFTEYFGRNLPLFVTLWLLGVLFLSLRFTGGLLYVQRLKYRQSRPLPAPWPGKLRALAERAGLRRPLQMLESLRLRTPVVVGHLKPVLLLPAGLVAGLPADEVEALLAHELAHVMRRDYLVNVLQHLLDILFFFHPGVRWISACVRQEREHCCDDFAVALCGDVGDYARALARLQVGGPGFGEPALAAAGRPQRLLRRISRLIGNPHLAHDFREGFVSALLLVVGLLGIMRMAAAAGGGVPARGTAGGSATPGNVASPASPAAVATPAAAESPATPEPPQRPERRYFQAGSFVLGEDGLVELAGKVPFMENSPAATWLVNARGDVVWYMTLSGKDRDGFLAFSEELALERGAYGWYLPEGSAAASRLRGRDDKDEWSELPLLAGLESARGLDEQLLKDRGKQEKQLQEEKLRLEQEYRAQMEASKAMSEEDRQRYEKELQMKLAQAETEYKLQEKEKRKLAEELQAAAKDQKVMSEEERERCEKELQMKLAQAEGEQKMKAVELKKLEEELEAEHARQQSLSEEQKLKMQAEVDRLGKELEMKELELRKLEQEKLMELKGRDREALRLAQEEETLKAEQGRLKAEEKDLKRLQENYAKFTAELAREGLIDLKQGYEVKLSFSTLVINGKKQPQKVFEKYRQFYETLIGRKLQKNNKVTFVSGKE
jgi:bla regulator protein BlaR1